MRMNFPKQTYLDKSEKTGISFFDSKNSFFFLNSFKNFNMRKEFSEIDLFGVM